MASTLQRDERLLAVGQTCSDPLCHLVDFLPFKCQHCSLPFCAEHFKVDAHKCSQYDESKHDRVAPSCPMCNEPVAIPPGQDPNIRMERHMDTECSVLTGRRQKKSAPTCARAKCGKVLFAPISCSKCNQQYCPAHRFPADHLCASTSTTTPTAALSKPAAQHVADISAKASAAGSSAAEAVKRKWAAMPTSTSSAARPAKLATAGYAKPPTPSSSKPFSSTDRSSPFPSTAVPVPRETAVVIKLPPINSDSPAKLTPPPSPTVDKPAPVINYMSFIPRSVFASA